MNGDGCADEVLLTNERSPESAGATVYFGAPAAGIDASRKQAVSLTDMGFGGNDEDGNDSALFAVFGAALGGVNGGGYADLALDVHRLAQDDEERETIAVVPGSPTGRPTALGLRRWRR